MAVSISELMSTLQNGVTAIRAVATALGNVFPQASSLSTSAATAGTITYTSSQAVAFMTVLTSTGGSYKIPLYS